MSTRKFIELPGRPRVYNAKVFDYETSCGSVFITVSTDVDGYPAEVFITKGASGGCTQAFSEALGKMASIALRCNLDPNQIVKLFTGISCGGGTWQEGKRITSCPGAVALALADIMGHKEVLKTVDADLAEHNRKVEEMRKERQQIDELG